MFVQKARDKLRDGANISKKHASYFKREFSKHTILAITTSLSLIIGLFWRDAIQSFVDDFLVAEININNVYLYKLGVALVVTVVAVVVLIMIAKPSKEES
ncbi:MAG: DUF5654 family protein [Nanoarchaeota archaeon]